MSENAETRNPARIMPTSVAELSRIVDVEDPRHSIHGIRLEPGENPTETRAIATDGRRLIVAELSGYEIAEFPRLQGFEPNGFEPVTVPVELLKSAAKAAPKGRKAPIPATTGLAITTNGNVATIATTDLKTHTVQSGQLEGKFPNYEKVIPPAFESPACELRGCLGGRPIGLNPWYLAEVATIMTAVVGHKKNDPAPTLILTPPKDPDSPIRFEITGPKGKATGVLMPMRLD